MALSKNHDMQRAAGILLHPTSLPGPFGIGDLGDGARAFVDWLASAKVSLWQILPLVPTGDGASPYSSWSAFAGNPDLIDLCALVELGLLEKHEVEPPALAAEHVDYGTARAVRRPLLDKAVTRLRTGKYAALQDELAAFKETSPWVLETALFQALKEHHRRAPWWEWPDALRDRETRALKAARKQLAAEVDNAVTMQFLFAQQWQALRQYAARQHVQLIGDVPIYVDGDSVDVWASRELFDLSPTGRPLRVSGVPPDAFSATGQLWGNPLYRWERMAKDNFAWWRARLARALELTDWVRIDHFRGLAAYWAVAAEAKDARAGAWVRGPGIALFDALHEQLGSLPIIAEDLGVIDQEVRDLLRAADLPGMRVLQFAFGEKADNPYLPHNHERRSVVYTGTHDNDTTLGWWNTQPESVRHHVRRYLGVNGQDAVWDLIRAALASVANFAILPMQDALCLDGRARMNTPAVADGNWRWRLARSDLRADLAGRLCGLVELYKREPTRP
jgi:4-alpha-glucanotransferase